MFQPHGVRISVDAQRKGDVHFSGNSRMASVSYDTVERIFVRPSRNVLGFEVMSPGTEITLGGDMDDKMLELEAPFLSLEQNFEEMAVALAASEMNLKHYEDRTSPQIDAGLPLFRSHKTLLVKAFTESFGDATASRVIKCADDAYSSYNEKSNKVSEEAYAYVKLQLA